MTATEVIEVIRESVWVMIKVAGPLMMLALVLGLIISIFQALTQIQEATLAFVPKMLAVFIGLIVMFPFMLNTLIIFTQDIMDRIVALG